MIFLHIDYVIMYYDYRLLFVCYIYVRLIAVLKFLLHFVVRKRTVSFVKREVPRGNRWKFEKNHHFDEFIEQLFSIRRNMLWSWTFWTTFSYAYTDGQPRFSSYVRAEIFRCFSFQAGLD